MRNVGGNSRFIGFIDECGDHSMDTIDKDFPIFVLCLTIIERTTYIEHIIPAIATLKLKFWNHEGINLHSRDIRKANGPYGFLQVPDMRKSFLAEISNLISNLECTIFIMCIDKSKHITKYGPRAENPYEFALKMCMERVIHFLKQNNECELPIIAESRGKREDEELERAFYEFLACGTYFIPAERFKSLKCPLVFWDKRANIAGLQVADLAAYPCARHILKPEQPNQAFDIINQKIYANGSVRGWKVFP
ncbi:MAG: DUF3800 domain-containing protein [Fibrobacter sp.]|nr:DUF3800 domain-containing protein [Fibrobacter sp.]